MSYLFPSSTITFEAAMRDLQRGSPRARAAAAHALGDVTEATEKRLAVDALVTALEDDVPEVRAEACSSLGDLGDTAAVTALIKRLDDGSTPVRQNAAIALGTIRHPDGFDPLVQALRSGPADLRFQAATSLAEIDPTGSFDHLLTALNDKDPQVIGAAALALGAIPAATERDDLAMRAKTALLEQLDHPNNAARFDVAYALSELGDPAGVRILVRGLSDPERAWDAVSALASLRDADSLAGVLTDRNVPPEATVLAAGSILKLGTASQAAQRVLVAGLTARKTHVRGLAVEHLAEVGGPWAIEPLEKLAKSGKGEELLEPIAQALDAIRARST